MFLKSRVEDCETTINLPQRVSRNESYMRDAVSSILSTYQKSLKKKLEIPRHVGGIWDCDIRMDMTEASACKSPEDTESKITGIVSKEPSGNGYRSPEDIKRFENPSSNDSSKKFISIPNFVGDVTGTSVDVMDTTESYDSGAGSHRESSLENFTESREVSKASSADSVVGGMDEKLFSSATQAGKLKKKNSDEFFVERSKRCKTSSSGEVSPNLSLISKLRNEPIMLAEVEPDMSARNVKDSLPLVANGLSKDLMLKTAKKDSLLTNKYDISPGLEESQLPSNVKVNEKVKSSENKKVTGGEKLYQKEIDSLQRVSSIFISISATNPLLDEISISAEVEHLQRIIGILKILESPNSSSDANHKISIDTNGKASDQAETTGDMVDFLPKKEIRGAEFQSKEALPNNSKDASKCFNNPDRFQRDHQNFTLSKGRSSIKSLPVWRRECADIVASIDKKADNLVKNNPVEKCKSPDVTKLKQDKSLLTEKDPDISHGNLVLQKIINGTLPWKASGSPPPAKAFSGTIAPGSNGSALPFTSPSKAVSTSHRATGVILAFKGTNATAALNAIGVTVPSNKTVFEPSPSKTMGATLSSKPLEATSLNGMVPSSLNAGEIPSNAIYEAALLNATKDTTFPSKALDAKSPVKAIETRPPVKAIETRPPVKSIETRPPVKAMRATSLSNAAEATLPSTAMDTTSPLKAKSTPVLEAKEQACPSRAEDTRPLLRDNEAKASWRDRPSLNGSSICTTPPRNNYSGIQVGRNHDRVSQPRPILPWRGKDRSTKNNEMQGWRRNEGSSQGRANGPWRREAEAPYSGSSRQHWRAKDGREVDRSTWDLFADKTSDTSKTSDDLEAVISLKVFGEKQELMDELMVPCNELVRVKRKFPNLFEVIPSADEEDKVIEASAEAVRVFVRCVLSNSYNLPCWEIALEAFALAMRFQVENLQDSCKGYFNRQPIPPRQVDEIFNLAQKFKIAYVLETSTMFAKVQEFRTQGSEMGAPYKVSRCSVSCTTCIEPTEFYIPLCYMKEEGLGSTIRSDVQNDILFEAVSGRFCITGFQIKLEAESCDLGKELNIFCHVFKDQRVVFSEDRKKPLRAMMIFNFKQKLCVKPKEVVKISVDIEDVCLRLCHCLLKDKVQERCSAGSFQTTFMSDKKTAAKKSLFFIEKLFYTFEGQKN